MKKLLTLFLLALSLMGFNSLTYAVEEGAKAAAQEQEMTEEQKMKQEKEKKKKGGDDEEPECD